MIKMNIKAKLRKKVSFFFEIAVPIFIGYYIKKLTDKAKENIDPNDQDQKMYIKMLIPLVLNFFISLVYSPSVSFVVSGLVKDKETKMKENLKIMGLSRLSYSLSYFIVQGLMSAFVSIVMALFITTNDFIFPNNGQAFLFGIILVIVALANTAFSMTFSTLFNDSKLAQMVGGFILVLPFTIFMSFVVGTTP